MKSMDKFNNDFIEKLYKNGFTGDSATIARVIFEMEEIIKNTKDATPEEIVSKAVKKLEDRANSMLEKYDIPGYSLYNKTGRFETSLYGGKLSTNGKDMSKDAIFDGSSMTKTLTAILGYKAIEDGKFDYTDIVGDISTQFPAASHLTIGDILGFTFKFRTDGNLAHAKNPGEAEAILSTIDATETGKYSYQDFGSIVLAKILEEVYNKPFEELVQEQLDKAGMKNSYLVVPKKKIQLVTGTANYKTGENNDRKAIVLGGFSGHAGAMCTAKDWAKLMEAIQLGETLPKKYLKLFYTESDASKNDGWGRGIAGHACVGSWNGKNVSLLSSTIQGSTAVAAGFHVINGLDNCTATLLNPASTDLDIIARKQALLKESNANIKLYEEYCYNNKAYLQVSPQNYVLTPDRKALIEEQNLLTLSLAYLDAYMKVDEPNYTSKVRVEKKNQKLVKVK